MKTLCRLCLPITFAFVLTGCGAIHNAIGPDKAQSELRGSVEAPLELTGGESPFCVKPAPVVAQAPVPYNGKLYFLLDKTVFTPESLRRSESIYSEVLERNSTEITIVGHTDTAASNEYNDALSRRRAEKVRQDLVDRGVSPDVIEISSHGEYKLEVATPDETVEVRNRRVEIHAR
jgi:OOP family OmpA-OmpF porin